MKLRYGFTLAEVLITLGIIGVVAAMTLPVLIGKWQKLVTVNKLKAAYSLISQAIEHAESDYGSVKDWTFGDADNFTNKYIRPYYEILSVYDRGTLP